MYLSEVLMNHSGSNRARLANGWEFFESEVLMNHSGSNRARLANGWEFFEVLQSEARVASISF